MSEYDVVIVGGGIVGMATAMALLDQGRRSVLVLEAEPNLAAHQTGRNSGVIHSGIYYKPGSLKARLCTEGVDAMFRFCEERGVKTERCGKVIVATKEEELPALAELHRRGKENGLKDLRELTGDQIQDHEPHVRGVAGLFVGDTGIVSYRSVLEEMAKVVTERGGEVRTGSRVNVIHVRPNGFVFETPLGVVKGRNVINCAGLQSDRVARMCGADPGLQIIPFRGEYYDLVPEKRSLCKNLIYPVPDARFPFLGVHFTRGTDNAVEAGPNAVLAWKREGYEKTDVSVEDSLEFLTYSGFWHLAKQHWRMGSYEMKRSLSKAAFVAALQALIPEVTANDVEPGRAGVRAQAVLPDGKLVDDFFLKEGPAMLHVLNAPSPAATASIRIGRELAASAERVFRPVSRGTTGV